MRHAGTGMRHTCRMSHASRAIIHVACACHSRTSTCAPRPAPSDRVLADEMMADFEWTIKTAVEEAEVALNAAELTIDPDVERRERYNARIVRPSMKVLEPSGTSSAYLPSHAPLRPRALSRLAPLPHHSQVPEISTDLLRSPAIS